MGQVVWEVGAAYEAYVGRWSRPVAREFVAWLGAGAGRTWLDVGCGPGALTAAALGADPARVTGVDRSPGFLAEARARTDDPRAGFAAGDARALPVAGRRFDVVVSGLCLNFVPEPGRAVAEFARVTAPGGVAAAYVWDYAEGMAMMRHFWDAAVELDPPAARFDEGSRFTVCAPEPLAGLWSGAGFTAVRTRAVEVATVFTGFADFWQPFLGGQGSAPGYVASLTEPRRTALRELLRSRLPAGPDGSIRLTARAWAVRGELR
ncbi:class I SAM-dependent methyltransferase [Amorphoplanes nipponensis]|uniref:Methyltransferase n=1 Tax=Actinoplanes nipponensis TaxID=135950 RepID=A0A919MIA5_9ACTN|nr:class I SAM-dependent methyltransferase [Actinoplanes nipponensis]GIE50539.1 methyltransferase [Actinoplanes nipponensis]